MEDRVVLTAELKDQMSAPLSKIKGTVQATASAVESANKKQASSTTSATAQIDKAISKQKTALTGLPGVFQKAGNGISRMFAGAKSAITGDLNAIVSESKSSGSKAGKGFADSMSQEVNRGLADNGGAATAAGQGMGSKIGEGMKTGAKVAGVAVAGILTTSIVKGFNRLSAIENAQAKLKGFGHSAEAITDIMSNASASVKGTAFGLDEAATVAAGAVAAGIAPGTELERVLKTVSNSAGAAGSSMGEMGAIFNKAATQNKAGNDILGQVADRGINIYGKLAEQMGVTSDEVFNLATEGKINFATFEKAMSAAAGTAADEMGKTTGGALKNLGAALGRFGAGLLGGVFPLIGPVFGKLTGWIDIATAKVGPLATKFSADLFAGLLSVYNILAKGDFSGPIFGLEEDSKLVDWLFDLREGVIGLVSGLTMGAATRAEFGTDLEGWVAAGARARAVFDGIGATIGSLDFSSWKGFTDSLSTAGGTAGATLGPAMASIGESLKTLGPAASAFAKELPNIGGAVAQVAAGGLTILTGVLSFLATHVDTLIKFMPLIVAGFVAWKVATMALASGTFAMQAAQVAMTPVTTLNNILRLTAIRLENQQTAASARNTIATVTNTGAQNAGALARTRAGLATTALALATGQYSAKTILSTVATTAATVAMSVWATTTKLASLAMDGLNKVFKANPIGLIVTAVVALVAGLVWFFTQTQTGQAIVQAAWQGIKGAISGVVDFWNGTLMPALAAVGAFFSTTWSNITTWVSGAVTNIMAVLGTIGAWFASTFGPSISAIGTVFSAVFSWIQLLVSNAVLIIQAVLLIFGTWLTSVFSPVVSFFGTMFGAIWTGIQWAVQMVVAGITLYLNGLVLFWQTILFPALQAVGSFFTMIWNGIVVAVQWVIGLIQAAIAGLVNFWNGVLLPALQAVGSFFSSVWNGIVSVVQWVVGLVQSAIGGMVGFWNGTLSPAISAVAGWFSDRLSPAISGVTGFIDSVKSGFQGFVDFISSRVSPIIDSISGAFGALGEKLGGVMSNLRDFAANPLGGAADWAKGVLGMENSGGGVYAGGGIAGFAGGGVLGGYAPGKDTIPAILSKGEAVLVPEVVRAIGPQNIMAANRAASGRKAGGGPSLLSGHAGGSAAVSNFFSNPTPHAGGGVALAARPSAPAAAHAPAPRSLAGGTSYGDTNVTIEKVEINLDNSGGGMTPAEVEAAVEAGIEKAFTKARKRDY